jgi:hypothetical protein
VAQRFWQALMLLSVLRFSPGMSEGKYAVFFF